MSTDTHARHTCKTFNCSSTVLTVRVPCTLYHALCTIHSVTALVNLRRPTRRAGKVEHMRGSVHVS